MKQPDDRAWALVLAASYRKAFNRLPKKFKSQVARKVQDLASDPHEGGSKLRVRGLDGVLRLRAGDFRIFYNYNDSVVQLLHLSRRDDDTYEDLDHLEIEALESFRIAVPGTVRHSIPEWEELAKRWAAPKAVEREQLPTPIGDHILTELGVPAEFHAELLSMRFVDELLACENIPADIRMAIVDALMPADSEPLDLATTTPVVVQADLVPDDAVDYAGPITAQQMPIWPALDGPTQLPLPLHVHVSRPANDVQIPFQGNASWGVGKEAKYVAKMDGTVQLTYAMDAAARALLTVDGHGELVAMVNRAKRANGASQDGGAFVINEHRQVLVPTMDGIAVVAGIYTRDLEFSLDETIVSPVARAGIRPGDVWPGPHVGICYTLAAGATDVRFERRNPDGTFTRVQLSSLHPDGALDGLLDMCRRVKPQGGRLFVNEARELFAPLDTGDRFERVYIGALGSHPWFPRSV